MYHFYENETRPEVLKPINSPFFVLFQFWSHTLLTFYLRQKLQVIAHMFLIRSRTSGSIDLQYPSSFNLGQRDATLSLQSWVSKMQSEL